MNATQLAERLEQGHTVFNCTAAAMLRKQDAAIKTLREALIDCLDDSRQAVADYMVAYGYTYRPARLAAMRKTVADAEAALAATEET